MANDKRDKKIYVSYIKDHKSIEELVGIYSLKPTTIKKIIKRISAKVDERNQFIEGLYEYTKSKYSKHFCTTLRNSLLRYVDYHDEYTLDGLIYSIKYHYIPNIGKQSLTVINEYIDSISEDK